MIAVQAGLVLVIASSVVSGWITQVHDGAMLVGLIALAAFIWTATAYEAVTEPVAAQSVTGPTPTIEQPRGPRGSWRELVLACIVCPVLVALAVGMILRAVAL